MMHLGALPYAMKHLGLSAPVYATEPVFRLGLLTMYDHFLSRWVSFMVLNIFLGRTLFNHTHFQYRRSRGRWRRRVRTAPPTRRSCWCCLRPGAVALTCPRTCRRRGATTGPTCRLVHAAVSLLQRAAPPCLPRGCASALDHRRFS